MCKQIANYINQQKIVQQLSETVEQIGSFYRKLPDPKEFMAERGINSKNAVKKLTTKQMLKFPYCTAKKPS